MGQGNMFNLLWCAKVFCVINLILNSIDAYFISVDETKFHLAKSYLCRYGYMNENLCQQHADDSLKFMQNNARDMYRGLLIFQTMFNITRTGKIDEETIMQMSKPRCGNKDFDLHFNSLKFSSQKANDFTALRSSLQKLTYTIRRYNPYLNRYSRSISDELVEYTIDRAFQIWTKHLSDQVRVTRLGGESGEKQMKSNITIYFAEGNHGDTMLFDGIDGELAHSYSLSNFRTPFRGHIHLDDSENWSKDKRLLAIVLHEIGHLFGLDHSSNPRSIMNPTFKYESTELQPEDIRNLRLVLGLDKVHHDKKTSPQKERDMPTSTHSSQTTSDSTTTTTTVHQTEAETTKIEAETTKTTVPTTTISISESSHVPTTEVTHEDVSETTKHIETTEHEQEKQTETSQIKIEDVTTTTPIPTTTPKIITTTVPITTSIEDTTTTTTTTIPPTTTTTISTTTPVVETTTTTIEETTSTTTPEPEETSTTGSIDVLVELSLSNATKVDEKSTTEPIETTIDSTTTTTALLENTTSVDTTVASTLELNTTILATEPIVTNASTTADIQTTVKEILTTKIIETTSAVSTTSKAEDLISTTEALTTKSEKIIEASLKREEPPNLCEDPTIDAITRTEWGNAFVFKGDYVWHIRGLTKWRLFDYEGWPKLISDLFPGLPSNIDSSFLYDDQYYFTKGDLIWRYKIGSSFYPPKYFLVKKYPQHLKEEYPNLPFNKVDGAFAVSSSVFLFKDTEFWQSDWTTNITGKIPFKVDAVLSWRNPRLDTGLNEPLAYIISNSSMYKFNYWSFPVSYEALDIRYFLFDCVQANYQPNNAIFLGPSYKQAFIADDIYNKEASAIAVPPHAARLIDDTNKTANVVEETVKVLNVTNNAQSVIKLNFVFLGILILILNL